LRLAGAWSGPFQGRPLRAAHQPDTQEHQSPPKHLGSRHGWPPARAIAVSNKPLLLVRQLASINAIRLGAELETRLGRDIDPTIAIETPAIGDLAMALAGIN
jgi:hypothetical protein